MRRSSKTLLLSSFLIVAATGLGTSLVAGCAADDNEPSLNPQPLPPNHLPEGVNQPAPKAPPTDDGTNDDRTPVSGSFDPDGGDADAGVHP